MCLQHAHSALNLKRLFINCPTTVELVSDHFRIFLENTNVQFNQQFMLLGTPNNITETLASLLNIEILIISLFLFNSRLKNKIPLGISFSFISNAPEIFYYAMLNTSKCILVFCLTQCKSYLSLYIYFKKKVFKNLFFVKDKIFFFIFLGHFMILILDFIL